MIGYPFAKIMLRKVVKTVENVSFFSYVSYPQGTGHSIHNFSDFFGYFYCSMEGKIVVGFDIEWKVTYKTGDYKKTAVLQLCPNKQKCFIFHLSMMRGTIFFNFYLAASLVHYRGDSLTHPMLITRYLIDFDPKITGSHVLRSGP